MLWFTSDFVIISCAVHGYKIWVVWYNPKWRYCYQSIDQYFWDELGSKIFWLNSYFDIVIFLDSVVYGTYTAIWSELCDMTFGGDIFI